MRYLIGLLVLMLLVAGCQSQSGGQQQTTEAVSEEMAQGVTTSELNRHSSTDDCWIVADGEVFDVTEYAHKHEKRNELLQRCGTDATELLLTNQDESVRVRLKQYYMGELR